MILFLNILFFVLIKLPITIVIYSKFFAQIIFDPIIKYIKNNILNFKKNVFNFIRFSIWIFLSTFISHYLYTNDPVYVWTFSIFSKKESIEFGGFFNLLIGWCAVYAMHYVIFLNLEDFKKNFMAPFWRLIIIMANILRGGAALYICYVVIFETADSFLNPRPITIHTRQGYPVEAGWFFRIVYTTLMGFIIIIFTLVFGFSPLKEILSIFKSKNPKS